MTKIKSQIAPADIPSGDSIIYEYGIRIDLESAALAGEQIALSRRLYNDIIASIRSVFYELQEFVIERAGDEAVSLRDRIDRLSEAFDTAKAADNEPAMKQIAEERREQWKALSAALKDTRKELQRDRRERIKQAELSAAWIRHETLLVGVSLELTGAFNAR